MATTLYTAVTLNGKTNSVVVVTVVPQNIELMWTAVEHCCYVIAQRSEDAPTSETSVTATHDYAKTIAISATAGNAIPGTASSC